MAVRWRFVRHLQVGVQKLFPILFAHILAVETCGKRIGGQRQVGIAIFILLVDTDKSVQMFREVRHPILLTANFGFHSVCSRCFW